MPILKKKVQLRRQQVYNNNTPSNTSSSTSEEKIEKIVKIEFKEDSSVTTSSTEFKAQINEIESPRSDSYKLSNDKRDSKNIIKNYGKAMCSFASSQLAYPYLHDIVTKKGYDRVIDVHSFMQYMKIQKRTASNMDRLRSLLVVKSGDSREQQIYKDLFREISIVFMKYFVVNWIYNSKLQQKTIHLKFQFKMLRRIQHPEHFTYLKTVIKENK